ncbi:hypothetical protein CW709_05800 [Candidatus Bathyarchaeota archaeon]|nr:MAG: hypothetical protein CW709_05800 [Candidatus Bathyarchaeota archaeon]RLG99400.1 MAG: hypothetical protein DRO28_01350 [Candidatus Bathyarchaeota archaeon]
MTLSLPDRPGQLLKALEPIAKNGGNIISIVHDRNKVSGEYALVSLIADFPSKESFRETRRELEGIGISVVKSEEVVAKEDLTVIVIGRFNLDKIVGRGLRIIDVELSNPSSEKPCMKLHVEVPKEDVKGFYNLLHELAEKEKALIITPV